MVQMKNVTIFHPSGMSSPQHRRRVYLTACSSVPFPPHVCAPFCSLLPSGHLLCPCVLASGAPASLHSSGSHAAPSNEGEVCPGGCGGDSLNSTRVPLPGRCAGLGPPHGGSWAQHSPGLAGRAGQGGGRAGAVPAPAQGASASSPWGSRCVQGLSGAP